MYKLSKFNIRFEEENTHYIYNSHKGSFATLNHDYQESMERISKKELLSIPNEHITKLKEAGFIVEEEIDEYLIYKYLTNQSKYSNDFLGLTIATTLQCNFRCPYCYEEHLDSYFNPEKEEQLKKFIFNNLEGKKHLSITWYGGEPLLQKNMIDRTSKEIIKFCDEKKITYDFSMISNGYLLTKEVAKILVDENKINSVQITLDGGPDTHNMTRYLRNGQGTFDKILENINEIADIINVTIRVNVSQENVADVHKLIPILIERGLNKKVGLYFSPVTKHEGTCQSVSESCLVTEEFSKWETGLIDYADKLGFEMGRRYPANLGGAVCTAVNNNTFVIDSEGDLFKCWNEVGKKDQRIGSLTEGITNTTQYLNWIEWQFPEKCMDCSIFPLCKGRCPDMSRNGKEVECNQLKFNIIDSLIRFYKNERSDSTMKERVKI